MSKLFFCVLFSIFFTACIGDTRFNDAQLPGYSAATIDALTEKSWVNVGSPETFTVINYDYPAVIKTTQQDVQALLHITQDAATTNQLVLLASHFLTEQRHIPYARVGAEGEGQWCNKHQPIGCVHIQQDPIYRTDKLNCITLVQLVLALINSTNLADYNKNIIAIDYGISQIANKPADTLSYANRNNFASADFNWVNNKNHRITDVTTQIFPGIAKSSSTMIDRARWFKMQSRAAVIKTIVRVLSAANGEAMVTKFKNHYGGFYHPEKVSIAYIPKLFLVTANGKIYVANEERINKIPVPSIVEIVRDDRFWKIKGKNVVSLLGTGINVSHVALLYRQSFQPHALIFQETLCTQDKAHNKQCNTKPVYCENKVPCVKTMMLAATNAFPDHYLWSLNKKTGRYACTAPDKAPAGATGLTTCDRVVAMPFANYLTRYSYGQYLYIKAASILGFNFQKIND